MRCVDDKDNEGDDADVELPLADDMKDRSSAVDSFVTIVPFDKRSRKERRKTIRKQKMTRYNY